MRGFIACVMVTLLVSLSLCGCSKQESAGDSRKQEETAKKYAGYRFGGEGVIDLGSQPLTLPEGAVAELMARDATLASRLGQAGLRLQVHPFFKGKDITEFLESRELEGGMFADMPALTVAASGDFVIVALLKQGFASIISKRPMLVRELKGKRVATGFGSAAHFTLLTALENEGLSERDITLVPMEVNEMPQALASGSIDAFSAWEPTPVMAFATHPEFHLVHKGISYGFLCLRRDFVTAHPAETRELAAAVARACGWMRLPRHLEQVAGWTAESAGRLQGSPYQLSSARMGGVIRNDLLNIPSAPRVPGALLSEEGLIYKKFTFLKRAGKIPESTPWAKVRDSFDTAMLRQVMAEEDRFALQRFDYRGSEKSDGAK